MKTFKKTLLIGALSLSSTFALSTDSFGSALTDTNQPRVRTRMQMRLQDPTVIFTEGTRYTPVLLTTDEKIMKGPAIKDMAIAKKNAVTPNTNGDFVFSYPSTEFD